MYLMVETIRVEMEGDGPERKAARQAFKTELGEKDCQRTVCLTEIQNTVCVCDRSDWLLTFSMVQ